MKEKEKRVIDLAGQICGDEDLSSVAKGIMQIRKRKPRFTLKELLNLPLTKSVDEVNDKKKSLKL